MGGLWWGRRGLEAAEFIEGLFGHPESVHRRGHPPIEDHLGDGLTNLLLSNADVQGALNVPAEELRAVPQHGNGSDGTEAAGLEVKSGAVVNLSIDHLVHQVHHLRRQLGHGRWRPGVSLVSIVKDAEVRRRLAQIPGVVF